VTAAAAAPRPEIYLGVDVGTTHVKVVAAAAEDGRVLATERADTPWTDDGHGPVHEATAVVDLVVALARQAWQRSGEGWVRGLACASIGEEGFFLDARGRPLYPSPVWYLPRESRAAAAFREAHPDPEVYEETGTLHSPIRSLHKWLWLREHHPEVLSAARTWLSVSEYVAHVLGGAPLMSRSQASRTLAWSVRREEWLAAWAQEAGVPPEALPPVVASGTVAGPLRPEALPGVRLAPGAQVAVGGHDHPVGAAGTGVRRRGEVLDSLGTAESLLTPVAQASPSPADRELALEFGATAEGEPFYVGAAAHSGRFLRSLTALVGGPEVMDRLDREAEGVEPGAGGLTFHPPGWLGGVGRLEGVPPELEGARLYRAVLEGWAMLFRHYLQHLEARAGTVGGPIYVIGGGARSLLSLRIRASVVGRPLTVVDNPEAVATGAARLAARSEGIDWAARPPAAVVEPRADWQEAYARLGAKG
jgi:xylulokinase